MGAWRILERFEKRGILEKVSPGTRLATNQRGVATVWR